MLSKMLWSDFLPDKKVLKSTKKTPLLTLEQKIHEESERKIAELKETYDLKNDELLKIKCEFKKYVKAKNYEAYYPVPKFLQDMRRKHPKACFIQILGAS